MNPNDVFVLWCLAWLEAAVGEHERAIEHGNQILRLNPRDARSYDIYHMLGVANFRAKQYAEGIRWALRALNDKPEMIQPRVKLASCYVGANEIAKARAVFAAGQRARARVLQEQAGGEVAVTPGPRIARGRLRFSYRRGPRRPKRRRPAAMS